MVVNSKIRDSDWLTSTLTIVNFNYVFIQPAPDAIEFNFNDNLLSLRKEKSMKLRMPYNKQLINLDRSVFTVTY